MRRKYNIDLINYLKENALKYNIDELLPKVNKMFNEKYDRNNLQKLLVRNKIQYKYKNKNMSHNMSFLPIGTEYTKSDGLVLVKVSRNEWKYKQRLIYEQYYNVELPDDVYVIFLDQDRTNFDIKNLRVITRRESGIMANQKVFSKIPEVTETAINVAKLMIKTKEKANE